MSSTATPPPELHLPDLPEVPVSLGPLGPAPGVGPARAPLAWRLREAVSTYLPLLLMALLAGSTWWLVKHTPQAGVAASHKPGRHDPDYTMRGFALNRFAPDGRFVARIEGDVLRHYPDTDRLEIEGVRIHAVARDGRITDARADRALANGDATEVQLLGHARVIAQLGPDDPLEIEGDFLHFFIRTERLKSHLPVVVKRGGSTTRAGGLDYDHLARELSLRGPVRASLPAGPARRP